MTTITALDLQTLLATAGAQGRRRQNLNLHADLSDPIQRLLNALLPGTYVCPHRHEAGIWESFTILSGHAVVLTFADGGRVLSRVDLNAESAVITEIPGGVCHSILALTPAVVFEIKPGPYRPATAKDFAAWAPPEGTPQAPALVAWMERAQIGEVF